MKLKFLKYIVIFSISVLAVSCSNDIDPIQQEVIELSKTEQTEVSSNHLKNEYKKLKAQVVEVIDGDTILVNIRDNQGLNIPSSVKIRMLCIDTPESTKKVQPFGPEASNFVKELLQGKEITLEIDKTLYDPYGRLLAHVFLGEQSVQEILLSEGLARVAYVFEPYK
jgi:micrococcal nuclease